MSLNRFYLDNVAPPASQDMVSVHAPINGGRVDTLCNVTAAAMAWLLTGKDCAPPFSDAWQDAAEGTGPEGSSRMGPMTSVLKTHMCSLCFTAMAKSWSWTVTGLSAAVREVTEAPPPDHGEHARHILL